MKAKLIMAANAVPINPSSPLNLKTMISQSYYKMIEQDRYRKAKKKRNNNYVPRNVRNGT